MKTIKTIWTLLVVAATLGNLYGIISSSLKGDILLVVVTTIGFGFGILGLSLSWYEVKREKKCCDIKIEEIK